MREIGIEAHDGKARAFYFAAPRPTTAGIIFYMDVFGIRQALFDMCTRLSGLGYNVLLPDLYYRLGAYGPFKASDIVGVPERFAAVRALRDATPITMTASDTPYFIKAITEQGATGKLGLVGYCMGGGRALRSAAEAPERIAAIAAIHSGRLAVDEPESPHLHLGRLDAAIYVGSSGEDEAFPPDQSALLAEALRVARLDHQIENYADCEHGWALPDNPIFNRAGSERQWRRLETLFGETLLEGATR